MPFFTLSELRERGKALLSDERAEDVKDDLQVAPNFPPLKLKPRLPTRTPTQEIRRGAAEVVCKTEGHDGAMVAVRIPMFAARQIAIPGGERPEDLHCTLVYLGPAADLSPEQVARLHRNLARVARHCHPIDGEVTGSGRFRVEQERPEGEETGDPPVSQDVLWAGLDAPDLPELRHLVWQAVKDAAIDPPGDHGFTPHVTLAYVDPGEGEDSMPPVVPVTIKWLSLCVAGDETMLRLAGESAEDTADRYERPTELLPPQTLSILQQPAQPEPFRSVAELESWAVDKGDLIVRADVPAVACVAVKKGDAVEFAIEGYPAGEPAHLEDLESAMRRIAHDYICYGWLSATALDGRWVTEDELQDVLTADLLASPVFLGCDLLALDGDLTETPARERLELMRAMLAQAGSHAAVPLQVECAADQELERAVDEAMAWRPSDGEGLVPIGVTVVRADSPYTHGPTDDEVRLDLRTAKAWSDEAREAAAAARRAQHASDARSRYPEQVRHAQEAGVRVDGVQEFPGREDHLVYTDPQTGSTLMHPVSQVTPESIRARLGESRAAFAPATKDMGGMGFGSGAGPGEPPDWRDHLPKDNLKNPNFLTPERKDGASAPGVFGTPGTSGIIAPQQGMFRKPRRFFRVAIERDDNTTAGTAVIPISTTPRRKPRPSDNRDAGGPLFPTYGRPDDTNYAEKVGWTDEAREAAALARQRKTVRVLAQHKNFDTKERWQGSGREGTMYQGDRAWRDHSVLVKPDGSWEHRYASGGHDVGRAGRIHVGGELRSVATGPDSKSLDDHMRESGSKPSTQGTVIKYQGGGVGGGSGDGDSFSVGPGVVGAHTFVVGQIKGGLVVKDPKTPRVNPYEALFQRKGVSLGVGKAWTDEARAAAAEARRSAGKQAEEDRMIDRFTEHMEDRKQRMRDMQIDPETEDRFRAALGMPRVKKDATPDMLDQATANPADARKPRKYPDVGEEMGFNDTYDSKRADSSAMAKSEGIMWQVDEPERVVPFSAAIRKSADGKIRLGKCYQRAGYFVMDYRDATLVHGTVSIGQAKSSDGRGIPIAHAWVEFGDTVYDGVQSQFYSRADYYEKMRAAAEQVYTGAEACRMMLERKTFGPWGPTQGMQR